MGCGCVLKILLFFMAIGVILWIAKWFCGEDKYEEYYPDSEEGDWMREHEKTWQPKKEE